MTFLNLPPPPPCFPGIQATFPNRIGPLVSSDPQNRKRVHWPAVSVTPPAKLFFFFFFFFCRQSWTGRLRAKAVIGSKRVRTTLPCLKIMLQLIAILYQEGWWNGERLRESGVDRRIPQKAIEDHVCRSGFRKRVSRVVDYFEDKDWNHELGVRAMGESHLCHFLS